MPGYADQFKRGEIVPGTSYRVEELIGSGGMGSVYRVEHAELGRRFVLKALHGHLASRQDLVARLKNEWRALGRLEHPNIVQVTDAGQTERGLPYYVMEHLRGATLAQLLTERKRLSPHEASMVVVDILAGLHAAHETGAVHRDIKPPNIFIVEGGTAKLLDFGIAKLRDQSAKVVTAGGISIGTPRYMAPEQASGTKVDGRADIYAAALVLYEMVVGRGPFSQIRDPNELVMAHIGQEPERADFLESTVPPELADLLQRWLSKSPESRPATAEFARRELLALAESLPVQRITVNEEVTVGGAYEASTFVAPGPEGEEKLAPELVPGAEKSSAATQSADAVEATDECTVSLDVVDPQEVAQGSKNLPKDQVLGWGTSGDEARADARPSPGAGAARTKSSASVARRPSVTPPPISSIRAGARDSSKTTLIWILATALVSFVAALGISRLVGAPEGPEAQAPAPAGGPNRAMVEESNAASLPPGSTEGTEPPAETGVNLPGRGKESEAPEAETKSTGTVSAPVTPAPSPPPVTADSRKAGNVSPPVRKPAPAPAPRVIKQTAAPREPKPSKDLGEELPESGLW